MMSSGTEALVAPRKLPATIVSTTSSLAGVICVMLFAMVMAAPGQTSL